MVVGKVQGHRSGALKQSNKTHKHGKHRSKGAIDVAVKGKISVKSITKKQKKALNKNQRRNQSTQIRLNKREEVLSKKRCLGGAESAPFLVCLLPVHEHYDPKTVLSLLVACDPDACVTTSQCGVTHVTVPRFKQRFAFIVPPKDNDLAILDALKISDVVLYLVSAVGGLDFGAEVIDSWGSDILYQSLAQGLPTPVVALTDLESVAPKKRTETKQNIQKIVSKWIPDEKLMCLDSCTDAINVIRKIGNQKRKSVLYRDRRAHMYAENVEYVSDPEGSSGTLKITGYLRGNALSVNDLVHVPGLGDFQMNQIDAPPDPFVMEKKSKLLDDLNSNENVRMIRVLERSDPTKQQSLISENIPDPMDAEQTWPTEEELEQAAESHKTRIIKKVPKGWSQYQASWIPDEDGEEVSDNDDYDDDQGSYMEARSEEESDEERDEIETITESEIGFADEKYDQEMDFQAEASDLVKLKAAKTDLLYPDEIDTPQEKPARERFQRYRGLESFRTSPWDTKENLPSDYARIFRFQDFDKTKRRILKEEEDKEGALPGWYVTIHVRDVSQLLWTTFKTANTPVIVFGLLPHEHKKSVMNVVLKRTANYTAPIKSKERLIFQAGYRRFIVNPIFSQHTNGNKHKYERFFQPDSTACATFFAPIMFPPVPILCYKEVNNKLILVGSGNVLSCSPDRIIIKRIVLSGHPFKVNKRSAVIRFMFFNREDIIYFKPCKLRTKHGRIGHIKEPLGTHGHMKCVFDGQLKSQDTVLLNLYKRVFPKWNYEECVVSCSDAKMD